MFDHASAWLVSSSTRARLAAVVTLLSATALVQGSGTFTPTGSMTAGRDGAAAVLLTDGKVLVTSGNLNRTSELYDPVAGAFVATGTLNEIRSASAAVGLADGRVLVVGGWDGTAALSTAELYEPSTGLFTPAGALHTPRVGATATRLGDGRVLIAGGYDGAALASAELFDPQSKTFTPTGAMHTARTGSATLLSDGTVLVAGGQTGDGSYTDTAEIYDPSTDAFAPAGRLGTARHGHEATKLSDGRVLITGGLDNSGTPVADAEMYDPADAVFKPAGRMRTARTAHRAVLLASGEVLAIAGRDGSGILTSAELYDPKTDAFESLPGLAEPRANPSVVALADGRLLVAGGRTLDDRLATSAETYNVIAVQPTSTSITSDRRSSLYGQLVSYRARVTGTAGVAGGNVRFIDGGALLLGTAPVDDAGTALLTTAATPAGVRSIVAQYEGSGPSGGSSSPDMSQSVGQAQTTSALAVAPLSVAYSDVIKLEATISGAQGEPPAQGVIFRIGTQQMNKQPVPLENIGGGVWRGSLSTPLLEASTTTSQMKPTGGVKIATASFTGVSRNYAVSDPVAKSFIVGKEDARVTYDGPRVVTTSSRGGSTATVPLKAIVRDIAVTLESEGDKTKGDVRLAQVYFIDRSTNALLGMAKISLGDPNDTATGIATYDWNVNIGPAAISKTYTVGIIISNYYQRNSPLDNVTITVTRNR